jgi:hypothetical protein
MRLEAYRGARLEQICHNIFPSVSTQVYDWERNPYSESSAQAENLTLREGEELGELQSNRTLKMRFIELSLNKFLDFCERNVSCHSQ